MAINPDDQVLRFSRWPGAAPDPVSLSRRWRRAHRGLEEALAGYRALRGRALPGDPAWIAAQLQVAEARRRCQELTEEIDALAC